MNAVRSRIINFRVSEDEFRRLKAATTLQNARCLSDFARTATLRVASGLEPHNGSNGPGTELQSLDRRLAVLESNVARLVDVLSNSKRGSGADS